MVKADSRRQPSCRRIVWIAYTKICTLFIPDTLLIYLSNGRLTTKARREAWREKFTLFLTYLLIGGLFGFWLEYITTLFCDPPATYDYFEVYANNSKMSTINGEVVNWHHLGNISEMTEQVNKYPHYDLSPMFPLFMQLKRPANQDYYDNQVINRCINGFNRSYQADNWLQYKLTHDSGYLYKDNQLISCPLPTQRNKTGAPCFYSLNNQLEYEKYGTKGALKFNAPFVYSNFSTLPGKHDFNDQAFVILDNKVLDVTGYLEAATNIVQLSQGVYSRSFALDRMFLPLELTILLFIHLGEDITSAFYSEIEYANDIKECLYALFYHGVVDEETDEGCSHVNVALWITLGCFLMYFLFKMNLANISQLPFIQRFLYKSVPNSYAIMQKGNDRTKMDRTLSSLSNGRYVLPYTLFFIPCFAESSEALRQTFDSLARTSYPDTRKLLFFVCDGLVKSRSDSKETYLCILDALGYSSTKDPELRSYISLGQGSRRINYAKVYAGFYESGRNRVPFLMVVKVGAPNESLSTTRVPGNRGKRDSLLIILGFLERCMNLAHNRITPLEFELFNLCYNLLGIDPRELKYMLVTDADIQVQDDVVLRLVSRLEADPKILAISGHIRPANPEENIITMLQIFPFYLTFYSGMAYEACLGTVTSLNGGFAMYRLWSESSSNQHSLYYYTGDRGSISNEESYLNNGSYVPIAVDIKTNDTNIKLKRLYEQQNHQLLPQKWPKLSDEIVVEEDSGNHPKSYRSNQRGQHLNEDEDSSSSSDDNMTIATEGNTTVSNTYPNKFSYRRRIRKKKKKQETSAPFAPKSNIIPCCIQPTVLRGLAALRPDTMHTENILLSGEEQYFGIILLQSNPRHRLAFEPEAIAYATLPTNFFALQALQIRSLLAAFHIQLEFQHIAKHLGIMYWIVSFTKLVDMIFSMPIIVYLYSIYIRYFRRQELAYAIIAGSFTCLITLYIFYFITRRQFKYVLWFVIYGLFSVPIFGVYFPLLAAWRSDYANRWYDTWPTLFGGYGSRLHGIMMDEKMENEYTLIEEEEADEMIVRMRLADFEVLEAEKMAQREKEQAEMLDAKFNGFTGYVSNNAIAAAYSHGSKPSWSSSRFDIPLIPTPPPLAQVKDGKIKHSRFASEEDARFLSNYNPTERESSIVSISSNSHNPFLTALDNPFDDIYGDYIPDGRHAHSLSIAAASAIPTAASSNFSRHKQSNSQSSYFSRSSHQADYYYQPQDMFVPSSENDTAGFSISNRFVATHHRIRSHSTSSTTAYLPPRRLHEEEDVPFTDNRSIHSIATSLSNSVISLERDAPILESQTDKSHSYNSPHHILGGRQRRPLFHPLYEGRSAPVHSKIMSNQ
ncbi:chitin synthase-domain-containing protein [Cokeromyces recurvatus]|uniref:chitin synthase-domain-containing protein n=1 Tax=Cokeromyces recurvatus TaxID=90255 RepID=UPI00221EBDEE|nr:chitin synthase-domain-containing protein [Cokeromyces recurvatus]KAI7903446.1 chitin synthase-domain-containing protein [Cokeromyces recurvatus]